MPVEKLKQFLDSKKIKYVMISHSPAYTAQGIAATAHIPGKELAKSVMVKLDGEMAVAVVPAPRKVNFEQLKAASKASTAELATEQEFSNLFPDCEVGAMPPFGNLYGMDIYADDALAEDDEIAFNAGSHTELMRLAFGDFQRLAEPKMAKIT